MESGYRLAYDEVVRALTLQAAALDGLRTRAGLLLSAASVATSFLGGQSLERGGLGPTSWIAVMSFVGLASAVLYVLWPRPEPVMAVRPKAFLAAYLAIPSSTSEVLRNLALHLETSQVATEIILDRLAFGFRVATLLLTIEVASWVASLAGVP